MLPVKCFGWLPLRGETENEVELRGKFSKARTLQRREINSHRISLLWVLDVLPNAIRFVTRMAFDVALCNQQILVGLFDLKVHMWRSTGIRNWLDGTEQILASGTGDKASKALEVSVLFFLVSRLGVEVSTVVITLPDFNNRIAHGFTPRIQDASAQPSDFSHGCVNESLSTSKSLSVSNGRWSG